MKRSDLHRAEVRTLIRIVPIELSREKDTGEGARACANGLDESS